MSGTKPTAEELENRILDILASFGTERSELHRDAGLDEVDMDSLDIVELSQILKEEYGVSIDMNRMKDADPKTVGDVLDVIIAHF